jgi:YesN/AraC family two-component response regulator
MKGANEQCIVAGMDDFLSKPIDREQLASCLERWLGNKESPAVDQLASPNATNATDNTSDLKSATN